MAKFFSLVSGLQILSSYTKKGMEEHIGGADHDIIWGADVQVSIEDAAQLKELGWHFDEETGWSIFC